MNKSDTDQVQRTITLTAPVDRVWHALTDYRQFNQWFRVKLQSPFVAGQPTSGNITYPGYEHLVMTVVVQKIEPQRLFSFTWHPYAIDPKVDYSAEPPTFVEFHLEPHGSSTRLTLTESGFDALPASRRDLAFRMNAGGWTEQMKNIEKHVTRND